MKNCVFFGSVLWQRLKKILKIIKMYKMMNKLFVVTIVICGITITTAQFDNLELNDGMSTTANGVRQCREGCLAKVITHVANYRRQLLLNYPILFLIFYSHPSENNTIVVMLCMRRLKNSLENIRNIRRLVPIIFIT